MSAGWANEMRSLLEAPAPAVLATRRADGATAIAPVWFRWHADGFEVVIAEGDPKLAHLRRDPRCTLLVFEANAPFRGVRVEGSATLIDGDVTEIRASIAGRYLGERDGARFAEQRQAQPGVLVRLVPDAPRVWDLAAILPT